MNMKWMCRNSFAEMFRPYLVKAWCGTKDMSDLVEAVQDCVCVYFVCEGKRLLSLAVRMLPDEAYIVGAVSAPGENWVKNAQKAIKILCKGRHVSFDTKRRHIAKEFGKKGWLVTNGSELGQYKVWKKF